MKQGTFEFYESLTLNENAIPKENGIRHELAHNQQKILISRNNSISYMLGMHERQVYLLKELQRIRND